MRWEQLKDVLTLFLPKSRQPLETLRGLAWASLKPHSFPGPFTRIGDHKHKHSPHCPYLRRGVVFTGYQRKLNKPPAQPHGADTHQWHRYHSSCLAARECTKSPPEVLSSPTFLSFYDKTLGSQTSAKQEIKEIFCLFDICSLFSVTSSMPLMAPPFQQTITSLDDSTLIKPLHPRRHEECLN